MNSDIGTAESDDLSNFIPNVAIDDPVKAARFSKTSTLFDSLERKDSHFVGESSGQDEIGISGRGDEKRSFTNYPEFDVDKKCDPYDNSGECICERSCTPNPVYSYIPCQCIENENDKNDYSFKFFGKDDSKGQTDQPPLLANDEVSGETGSLVAGEFDEEACKRSCAASGAYLGDTQCNCLNGNENSINYQSVTPKSLNNHGDYFATPIIQQSFLENPTMLNYGIENDYNDRSSILMNYNPNPTDYIPNQQGMANSFPPVSSSGSYNLINHSPENNGKSFEVPYFSDPEKSNPSLFPQSETLNKNVNKEAKDLIRRESGCKKACFPFDISDLFPCTCDFGSLLNRKDEPKIRHDFSKDNSNGISSTTPGGIASDSMLDARSAFPNDYDPQFPFFQGYFNLPNSFPTQMSSSASYDYNSLQPVEQSLNSNPNNVKNEENAKIREWDPTFTPVIKPDIKPEAVNIYQYQGCFLDKKKPGRDLKMSISIERLTVKKCVLKCKSKRKRFAALQYGYLCFCGSRFGRYGRADESKCNTPCYGDPQSMCGGAWYNSVYSTDGQSYSESQFSFITSDPPDEVRAMKKKKKIKQNNNIHSKPDKKSESNGSELKKYKKNESKNAKHTEAFKPSNSEKVKGDNAEVSNSFNRSGGESAGSKEKNSKSNKFPKDYKGKNKLSKKLKHNHENVSNYTEYKEIKKQEKYNPKNIDSEQGLVHKPLKNKLDLKKEKNDALVESEIKRKLLLPAELKNENKKNYVKTAASVENKPKDNSINKNTKIKENQSEYEDEDDENENEDIKDKHLETVNSGEVVEDKFENEEQVQDENNDENDDENDSKESETENKTEDFSEDEDENDTSSNEEDKNEGDEFSSNEDDDNNTNSGDEDKSTNENDSSEPDDNSSSDDSDDLEGETTDNNSTENNQLTKMKEKDDELKSNEKLKPKLDQITSKSHHQPNKINSN